jgi:RNA polymerase sigma factor (sigma-70 family)
MLYYNQLPDKYMNEIKLIPHISDEEARELANKIKEGSEQAFQTLWKSHLKLIVKVSHKFRNFNLPLEDLLGEGVGALRNAVQKFDPEKGPFGQYATHWIINRIRKVTDKQISNNKRIINLEEYITHKEHINTKDILSKDPSEISSRKSLISRLKYHINNLGPLEKAIINLRYGLDDSLPKTYEEISKRINKTRERARQIHNRVIQNFREHLMYEEGITNKNHNSKKNRFEPSISKNY